MASRRFTLAEANALIPRLEMVIERLQRTARALRVALRDASEQAGLRTTADVLRVRPDLAPTVREMERAVTEIQELGGQLKGVDLGLVDFLAEIDGRSVLLCWQYGEKAIGFWHGIDDGFAGRRALPAVDAPPLQ